MLAHYEGAGRAPDGEWMARLKLVLAAPAIRGEYLKVTSDMREAEKLSIHVDQDLLGCFRRGLPGGLVLGSFEELAVDSGRSWDI